MKRSKLSIRAVALESGIDVGHLWRILAGERGLPSDDQILTLGRVLKIDPPERLLIKAGRIPLRSSGRLTPEEMESLLEDIRAAMAAPKRSRRGKIDEMPGDS